MNSEWLFLVPHAPSGSLRRRVSRPGALAAAMLVVAFAAAGCTSQLADMAEPTNTPARPAADRAFPSVNDMPATRDTKPLSAEERQRISDELSAIRDRQAAETAAATGSTGADSATAAARKPTAR